MGTSQSRDKAEVHVGPAAQQQATDSSCPVPEQYRNPAVYNVYSERVDSPGQASTSSLPSSLLSGWGRLDPRNNMPAEANQQPCAGQRRLISTDRMASSIRKGGTDTTWVYPSPQMFYNALKRKGKGDDVTEADMDAVVHAHNTMNELTWQRVMDWEQLHREECRDPTLLRFEGKPDKLSPMARFASWFGGGLPFDRHDWIVDRCGQEVRYIIDFYFDDEKAGTPEGRLLASITGRSLWQREWQAAMRENTGPGAARAGAVQLPAG